MAGQRVSIVRCCASVTKEEGWGWLRAMFGPQAERVGGEGRQRIWGVELRPCSQGLWAGRAPWDLQHLGQFRLASALAFCWLWDTPARWSQLGAGQAPLLLRWGPGPQHLRHWRVLTPRTDSVPPSTQATWERVPGLWVKSPSLLDLSFPIRQKLHWVLPEKPPSCCLPTRS